MKRILVTLGFVLVLETIVAIDTEVLFLVLVVTIRVKVSVEETTDLNANWCCQSLTEVLL